MLRRILSITTVLITLIHAGAYAASGWIARGVLANRTLDGERQPPERWEALLHGIVLRSGVITLLVLGVSLALLSRPRVREELSAFWNAEESPVRLGVFRAFLFGAILIVFDVDQTVFFARLPPVFVQGLPDPLPLWRLIVPAPDITPVLCRVFLGLAFLGMIGLYARAAAAGVAALGFYLLGLPQIYGKVDHYHHLIWFSLILACSPSGDAFSVDALLRRARRPGAPDPGRGRAYALPIRLVWITIGVMYFWPGYWKIVQHGPAWVLADNFRAHLYLKWFEEETFHPLFRIDRYPLLCTLGSAYAIVFELSWIFLMPFKRTRPVAVFMGLMFHNMTWALMNIAFLSLQLCYASFVDWERVFGWVRGRLGRGAAGSEPAGAPAPVPRALVPLVAGILAMDMAYGAIHQTDAWPFACYPTFSTIIRREHRTLYVKITGEGAAARAAASDKAIDAFRSERYAAVLYGVVNERDEARRQRKLSALAGIIRALDRSIVPGETIVIGAAVFSTDPDVPRVPREDKVLYSLRVAEAEGQGLSAHSPSSMVAP